MLSAFFTLRELGNNGVRSGIRTHAHIRGPECSVLERVLALESGALDGSAIMTAAL